MVTSTTWPALVLPVTAVDAAVSPNQLVAVTFTLKVAFAPTVVSLLPAVRAEMVGADGVARFADEPQMSWYSSGSCYSPLLRVAGSFLPRLMRSDACSDSLFTP